MEQGLQARSEAVETSNKYRIVCWMQTDPSGRGWIQTDSSGLLQQSHCASGFEFRDCGDRM
jgi:hypothetical protein